MIFTSGQNGGQFNFHSKNQFAMPPYHILIVIISSVILENLALLTKSEQSGPKPAHIRPTTLAISHIQQARVEMLFYIKRPQNIENSSRLYL